MKMAMVIPLAAVVMLSSSGLVAAHSFPIKETPSAGQTLTSPPPEVSIKFDAPIEPLFAQLHVIRADGKDAAAGAPQVTSDGYNLSVKLPKLAPGSYSVHWAVVCIDTHHTSGSYEFTISGAGA